MSEEQPHEKITVPTIQGTVISPEYTVILRNGCLEFYYVAGGPWEKRNAPDFLLTDLETDSLFDFLLAVLPKQNIQTRVFET